MPSYELTLLLKTMPRHELKTSLKRITELIFDNSGLIRSIENLGQRKTPYKIKAHGGVHHEASYFVVKFDSDTETIPVLDEEYSREVDILRRNFYTTTKENNKPCTLDNELKPPAYRDDVKKLIAIGKTQGNPFTHKFKYNSGLDYYPFQK